MDVTAYRPTQPHPAASAAAEARVHGLQVFAQHAREYPWLLAGLSIFLA